MIQDTSELISYNNPQRVYFKQFDRQPSYGIFVKHTDHDYLISKKMVRFVTGDNIQNYEKTKNDYFTKIISITTIKYLDNY